MMNRQALEDAVFDVYPDIDMPEIERMSDDKLEWLLQVHQGKRLIPQPKDAPPKKPKKPATLWEKVSSGFELRDNALVHVESWRVTNEAGHTVKEYIQQCGERVYYEGRTIAASRLIHFLKTGDWVKRVPKPKRHRASVRDGARVVHLGYFDTEHERDAAVFTYRMKQAAIAEILGENP
jgi:hypothetical protein